jgi:hypothetical protein
MHEQIKKPIELNGLDCLITNRMYTKSEFEKCYNDLEIVPMNKLIYSCLRLSCRREEISTDDFLNCIPFIDYVMRLDELIGKQDLKFNVCIETTPN